jgi:hypothetical protein
MRSFSAAARVVEKLDSATVRPCGWWLLAIDPPGSLLVIRTLQFMDVPTSALKRPLETVPDATITQQTVQSLITELQ